MKQVTLRVQMHSEWLVSGALDCVTDADQSQLRDAEGLPYIPGRSLRGLLREAAESIAVAGDDETAASVEALFGSEGKAGTLRVGDALLPSEVLPDSADGLECARQLQDFVTTVTRTALDPETGSARRHTLRTLEVGIPGLELFAPVEVPTETDLALLACAAALVRSLGANRYRGLGRCRLTLIVDGNECVPPVAPGDWMGGKG